MRAKTLLLAPLIVAQALWVVLRATRLPEPAGPREGRAGEGPLLRLLIIGDSSAAGVGAMHQNEALAGKLVATLSQTHAVEWRLIAKTGATAASTFRRLRREAAQPCDVVVSVLGVNDSKNGVSLARWRRSYTALLDRLQNDWGATRIILCAVPPLEQFPILPAPLNRLLGTRAARLDAELSRIARERDAVHHFSPDMVLEPAAMASDGFHPGPELYGELARKLVQLITMSAARRMAPPYV